jgi:hypothetical protein
MAESALLAADRVSRFLIVDTVGSPEHGAFIGSEGRPKANVDMLSIGQVVSR